VTDTHTGLIFNPYVPFVDPTYPRRAHTLADADRKYWDDSWAEYCARRKATTITPVVHWPTTPRSYVTVVRRESLGDSPRHTPITSPPPLSVPFEVMATALTNLGLQDQISAISLYDVLKKELKSTGRLPGASSHSTSLTSNQPLIQR
jgi:hypothetical protein